MTTWSRRTEVVWRRSGTQVLVRPLEGLTVILSGTDAAVWDLLDDAVSEHELRNALASRFGADPAEVKLRLRPALDELVRAGVLQSR